VTRYRLQVIQILTSGELAAERDFETGERYLLVPRSCLDCRPRMPLTVPPAPGYDAALVYTHEPSCPCVRGLTGRTDNR
jgi:hypothetical protein